MAAQYVVQSQRRTVQVLGSSQVQDVMEVGFATVPSGVYAQVLVPYTAWQQEGAAAFLEPIAEGIEDALAQPDVTGASFVQEIDANGLLTDALELTVTLPSAGAGAGSMSTTVTVPVSALGADPSLRNAYLEPLLASARKALQATAAL